MTTTGRGVWFAQLHTSILTSDSFAELSDGGKLLFLLGLPKAIADGSDGVLNLVSPRLVYRWCPLEGGERKVKDAIDDVVRSGMLVPVRDVEGHYAYPKWDQWQRTGYDGRSEAASRGNHERWHVGRRIVKEGCAWCHEGDDLVAAMTGPLPIGERVVLQSICDDLDAALDDLTSETSTVGGYVSGLQTALELGASLGGDATAYLRHRVVAHAVRKTALQMSGRELDRLYKAADQLGDMRIIGALLDAGLADIKGSPVSYVIAVARGRMNGAD